MKPLSEEMRKALHDEAQRLKIVRDRWHEEFFRLERLKKTALGMTERSNQAIEAIERLLSHGQLQLPKE